MPRRTSSKEQTLVVVLWAFLGACVWTGCGPGRTLNLVNGYECYIDNSFIMISHPHFEDSFSHAISDVGELDLVGDVLFGSRVDWDSDVVIGYFIIDTLTHDVQLIDDWQVWTTALDGMSITDRNVRWPGVFFHGFSYGSLGLGLLVLLVAGVCVFYIIRGLARHELEIRRRKTLGY